jgi:hypothetical protein
MMRFSMKIIALVICLLSHVAHAEGLEHLCPPVSRADPAVSAPPASLALDPFFKKYIDAQGIPIAASGQVCDRALQVAYEIVTEELSGPSGASIRRNLVRRGARVDIFSDVAGEHFTDLPEAAWLASDAEAKRRCGGGATAKAVTTKVCEGNLLAGWWLRLGGEYAQFHTRSGRESILFHEFGHMIQDYGLDDAVAAQVRAAYAEAKKRGLFPNLDGSASYMMQDEHEFFACATSDWFNASGPHNPSGVWNRRQLQSFPELYSILASLYPDDHWAWPNR